MTSCIEFWKTEGTWDRIRRIKEVFVEPRSAADMVPVFEEYEAKIASGSSGAIFFAVCRGKASEGIDFSDCKARAVVITGLPYPPYKDPRVVLKRNFLDERRRAERNATGSGGELSGNLWYSQQASRAVNQAVGRVIRHKDDFRVILLCDERFASLRQKGALSAWLRSRWRVQVVWRRRVGEIFQGGSCDRRVKVYKKPTQSGCPTVVITVPKVPPPHLQCQFLPLKPKSHAKL